MRNCAALTTTWSTTPHFLKQTGDAFVTGDVGRNGVGAHLIGGGLQTLGIARGDHHLGALALGHFGGRQTDTGGAPDDDDLLTCKTHPFFSSFMHNGT